MGAESAATARSGPRERTCRFGLEVDPAGELEVAAAGVAGGAANSPEVGVVHVGLNAAEGDLVGDVLAIGTEDELQPFGDAEGAADAAVEAVRTGVAQTFEGQGTRRIAEGECLWIAVGAGAAFAGRIVGSEIRIGFTDRAGEIMNRRERGGGDAFAPASVLANGFSGKAWVEVGHAGSGEREIAAVAAAGSGSDEQRCTGRVAEGSGEQPSLDDLADDGIGRAAQAAFTEGHLVGAEDRQVLGYAGGADRAVGAVLSPGPVVSRVCGGDGKAVALRTGVVDLLGVGVVGGDIEPVGHALVRGDLQGVVAGVGG